MRQLIRQGRKGDLRIHTELRRQPFLSFPANGIHPTWTPTSQSFYDDEILVSIFAPCQSKGNTYTTWSTLTRPVKPRNHGFVSINIRLISSSSDAAPVPCCLAASSKPAVIEAKSWNLKNDIGWKVISRGRVGVVWLISTYCDRRCQNSFEKIMGL